MSHFPKQVKIIEVGPRDGLQGETQFVPTDVKVDFINQLSQTGLRNIEVTGFVPSKWVPQMADHVHVMQNIIREPEIIYSALVPNEKGLQNAIACHAQTVAVLTSASETFSQKNTNCSRNEGLHRAEQIIRNAKRQNIPTRAYISCALGCPYEGKIAEEEILLIAKKLIHYGCDDIAISDTIGVATPNKAQSLIKRLITEAHIPVDQISVHFHDTYGQALTNIYACLELGIHRIDSAVGGLGGCPYAPKASGNVATEDVVYMLNGMRIYTGIDLKKLMLAGRYITQFLNKAARSKVAAAMATGH